MSTQTELPPLDLDLDLEALERSFAPTPAERLLRLRAAVVGRLRANWLDVSLLAVLLIVAGAVQARGMYISPARFDDEGTYTAYAWSVEYLHRLAHYTYWYAHPPLGQLQMAFYNIITDAFDRLPYAVATGREFALVCKIISVALLYGLARRLDYGRLCCVLAVAMFSLSPLAVYFQRTALLDNLVTPWLLAACYFAAARSRSIGAAAASAACFAIAVLSKETALLFMPAVLMLFFQRTDRRNRKFTIIMFAMVVSLLGLMYPLYAAIKNELWDGPGHVSLEWAIRWQLFDRTGSGSIFDPKSTAHTVVTTWLNLDPWSCAVCLAAVLPGLVLRRTRAVSLAFSIQLSNLLRSGYLPYPFVIAMIPFAVLTFAGVIDVLWRWSKLQERRYWRFASAVRQRRLPLLKRAWVVVFDDGCKIPLERGLHLGRPSGSAEPLAVPTEEEGVPEQDIVRALSRKGLEIYTEKGSLFVVDHGSTGGTFVACWPGIPQQCAVGTPVELGVGSVVHFEDHALTIERMRLKRPLPGGAAAAQPPAALTAASPAGPTGRARHGRATTVGGRRSRRLGTGIAFLVRSFTGLAVVVGVLTLVLAVAKPWAYGLHDLWTNDRDAGKAAAAAWLQSNTDRSDTLVVDDAFWVDLVRSGHPASKVIWFTKLDVDKDVQLPAKDAWRGIDYVVLDHQDVLALHLNNDLTPSADTSNQFPTMAKSIKNGQIVARFGVGIDQAMIWRVNHRPVAPVVTTKR